MSNVNLYHVSSETTINAEETLSLGVIFKACIDLRIFIVGYNVLECVNGNNQVLLALLIKDEEDIVEKFENIARVKLVKVERDGNEK